MSESQVWWYSKDSENVGPCSLNELLEQFGGKLPMDTMVWRKGWDDWKPIGSVDDLGHITADSEADGVVMRAKGTNGSLELLENPDKVRIVRKGAIAFLTQGVKGDKEILLSRASSIQFKKPSTFTKGYIQIGFGGGNENKGGLFDATKDENTIMFADKHTSAFETVKAEIERRMHEASKPSTAAQRPVGGESAADEIKKLAELHDQGLLSDEEFAAGKKKILGS